MILPLLVSLSTLASGRPAPIEPVALHELVAHSDLIALVRPGPSREGTDRPGVVDAWVELVVEEVLVGKTRPASVKTSYEVNVACPAQPEYPEGERVLAFLVGDAGRGWRTVGLSYGAKRLGPVELDVYHLRILELVALIERLPESWQESPQFVEWLVRCAEEPATRWEGAYALDPTGDCLRDEFAPSPAFGHRLDRAQRARLLTALLRADSIDTGEMCLLKLLAAEPTSALDDFALSKLMALVPDEPDFAGQIMLLLADRSGDAEMKRLALAFDENWWGFERGDPEFPPFCAASVATFVERVRALR